MAIRSNAFGRVTLTDEDARKFNAQVSHGRPRAEAQDAVVRGREMVRALQAGGGTLKIKVQTPQKG